MTMTKKLSVFGTGLQIVAGLARIRIIVLPVPVFHRNLPDADTGGRISHRPRRAGWDAPAGEVKQLGYRAWRPVAGIGKFVDEAADVRARSTNEGK